MIEFRSVCVTGEEATERVDIFNVGRLTAVDRLYTTMCG